MTEVQQAGTLPPGGGDRCVSCVSRSPDGRPGQSIPSSNGKLSPKRAASPRILDQNVSGRQRDPGRRNRLLAGDLKRKER